MLSRERTQAIAQEWIDAWNGHNIDVIMSYYADNIEFSSPFVVKLTGDPKGILNGKAALRVYFLKALAAYPKLRFKIRHVFGGVNTMVVHYWSVKNMAASEVMVLNEQGKIVKTEARYSPDPFIEKQ